MPLSLRRTSQRAVRVGLIFGKFYPLHRGHIYLIEKASTEVDALHVFLGCETERDRHLFEESHLPRMPTSHVRLRWLKKTVAEQPHIHVHRLDEDGIPAYPTGWEAWSERVKRILAKRHIEPSVIFTSEKQDHHWHKNMFDCSVRMIDEKRSYISISATDIRHSPYIHWNQIARVAQPFLVKRICITPHPSLPHAASQFAALYNTVHWVSQTPSERAWARVAKNAYRYVFTTVPMQNKTAYHGANIQPGRAEFLIPAHTWSASLDSSAVFDRIWDQLRVLN